MPVSFLQNWLQRQCNGYWERGHGVTIESLAQPGWLVTIDLLETPLETASMEPVRRERSDKDWLICETSHGQFRGQGDAQKLVEILTIFQNWAKTAL